MISAELRAIIREHALAEYPKEAGGFIIDGEIIGRDINGTYVPIENISDEPNKYFVYRQQDYIRYSSRLTAFFHSHPDGEDAPSAGDMLQQINMAVPFVIITTDGTNCGDPFEFGDQLERLPLEGRGFRHGVADCYEAGRDWYFVEHGIVLPQIPRDWCWWETGQRLYEDNLQNAGFRYLSPAEASNPQAGDAFFVAIGTFPEGRRTPNHGGIYLGNGLIYHHLSVSRDGAYAPSHLARKESGVRYLNLRPIFLRHKDLEK